MQQLPSQRLTLNKLKMPLKIGKKREKSSSTKAKPQSRENNKKSAERLVAIQQASSSLMTKQQHSQMTKSDQQQKMFNAVSSFPVLSTITTSTPVTGILTTKKNLRDQSRYRRLKRNVKEDGSSIPVNFVNFINVFNSYKALKAC
jgi:hypothetical protein